MGLCNMGVKKIQISNENWMDTFNRIHNPGMFNDEKKKKKTKKKKTNRRRNTAKRYSLSQV